MAGPKPTRRKKEADGFETNQKKKKRKQEEEGSETLKKKKEVRFFFFFFFFKRQNLVSAKICISAEIDRNGWNAPK